MADVTIPVTVDKNRRIVIDVPDDVPLGPAEVVIRHKETPDKSAQDLSRETVRQKLLAANFLVENIEVPQNTTPLSDEELYQLDQRPPGSETLDDLINEDRGEY